MSNRIGVDVETIAIGQNLTDHLIDTAKQCLMLQLFVAEPNERLKRNLVAEPVILAQLQDLGIDESLDHLEDIGVSAALDLTHEAFFVSRQGRELIRERKPVGQEFVGSIKAAPSDDILINVPSHTLACLDGACIAVGFDDS